MCILRKVFGVYLTPWIALIIEKLNYKFNIIQLIDYSTFAATGQPDATNVVSCLIKTNSVNFSGTIIVATLKIS